MLTKRTRKRKEKKRAMRWRKTTLTLPCSSGSCCGLAPSPIQGLPNPRTAPPILSTRIDPYTPCSSLNETPTSELTLADVIDNDEGFSFHLT
jgi:hypothetical protein